MDKFKFERQLLVAISRTYIISMKSAN